METRFELLEEEFLDAVFDYESKLDRADWEKKVMQNCSWVVDPV